MLSDVGGWGVSKCSGRRIVFIKENWIYAMARHHAEPDINILLTRNLPFDSYVRQWSHPLMIPLHCLWAKSNNRTRGQFECDVNRFCFCFNFVRSHTCCGCCSIVCLRFQVVQIKQIDCKLNTLLCQNLRGMGGQIANFGKKHSSSFQHYRRMT